MFASVTIDLDGIGCYHSIHGLEPPGAEDPIYEVALDRFLELVTDLEIDATLWPEIWYKGGSEPGVFATTWRLVGSDGREFVVAAFLNDPDEEFSEIYAIDAMMTVFAAFEALVDA